MRYFTARKGTGFTLVELVTTIILLAILSVVALPRLLTTSSYSAYSLRVEFIAELRKVQLMALNNSDRCYRLSVTPRGYRVSHFAARSGNACSGTLERTDALQKLEGGASLSLISSNSSSFHFDFDTLGRPHPGCGGACVLVQADDSLSIAIESEGYIHEG